MTASVWIVYAEVKVRDERAAVPPDASDVFVECYVTDASIISAIERASEALQSDGYSIESIDRCIRFDPDDWDEENDPDS